MQTKLRADAGEETVNFPPAAGRASASGVEEEACGERREKRERGGVRRGRDGESKQLVSSSSAVFAENVGSW